MLRRTPLKRNQKPLKRTKIVPKQKALGYSSDESKLRMRLLFLEIWDERQDEEGNCYCFETGKKMKREIFRELSSCYDHVLEKNDNAYPQYKFTKKNIIIVLPEVHDQKGKYIDKTPKIKKYRDELLNLHNQNLLEDDGFI